MDDAPLRSAEQPGLDRLDMGRTAYSERAPNVGEADVLDLIRRADKHALGRGFLMTGAQDSVAVTFGVHAFVVDAAREHLA